MKYDRHEYHHHPVAGFYFALFVLLTLTLLSSCSTLGLTKPESFEDRLRYGQAGVSAVYKTIGDQKAAGAITAAQGIDAFQKAERIEIDLSKIEALAQAGDTSSAQGMLTTTLLALTLLQSELKSKAK